MIDHAELYARALRRRARRRAQSRARVSSVGGTPIFFERGSGAHA